MKRFPLSSLSACSRKFLSGLLPLLAAGALAQTPTSRDPWLWPFPANSIWNTPLGNSADLVPAGIVPPTGSGDHTGDDPEYLVKVWPNDPWRNVYQLTNWVNRTTSTTPASYFPIMQVPDSFWPINAYQGFEPNNCGAFLQPDGDTIIQVGPCDRKPLQPGESGTQPQHMAIYGWPYQNRVSLRTEQTGAGWAGSAAGDHWGAHLSALGGSIRVGELTSPEPIRHALKVILWGRRYLHHQRTAGAALEERHAIFTSTDTRDHGYRWPATSADQKAGSDVVSEQGHAYYGTNRELVMGSLLAIHRNATPEGLNLQTEVGQKLFYALQNYGAYVVDNAGWNSNTLCVQQGVLEEVHAKYGESLVGYWDASNRGNIVKDMEKLFQNLYVVRDNSSTNIGGAGPRRAPLAPSIPAAGQTLPIIPGAIYRLTPKTATDRAIDVIGAGGNGTNTICYTWTGSDNQRWKVVRVDGTWHKLVAEHMPGAYGTAGMVLDASTYDSNGNIQVKVKTDTGSTAQQWQFIPSAVAGTYLIQPRSATSSRLTAASTANGAAVICKGTTSADDQRWILDSL